MALLEIPPPIVDGLNKIAALDKESYQEFLSSLENIPLRIRQHHVFDETEIPDGSIPLDDAQEMRHAIFGFYLGRIDSDVSVSTYVDDIVETLKRDREEDEAAKWERTEGSRKKFKERLIQLLNIKPLEVVAKAHNVLLEHEQTFSEKTRVMTDIRPVFIDGVDETPGVAVIVQMLNIKYMEAGRRQKLALALDVQDVQILMDTLERAKAKAEKLKSLLAQANVTYIDVV